MANTGLISSHQLSAYANPQAGQAGTASVVLGNDNTTVTGYNTHDSDPTIHVQSSNIASRPAAAVNQRFWITTDTLRIYLDSGSQWNEVAYALNSGPTIADSITINSAAGNPTLTFDKAGVRTAAIISTGADIISFTDHLGNTVFTINNGALTTTSSLASADITGITVNDQNVLTVSSTHATFTHDVVHLNTTAAGASGFNWINAIANSVAVFSVRGDGFVFGAGLFVTNANSGGPSVVFANTDAGSGAETIVQFKRNTTTVVGSISTTDTTTTYATSSDERLKTWDTLGDVGYIIDGVLVVAGAFRRNPSEGRPMMLAQQVYNYAPWAVTVGGNDPETEPWQIDHSQLVPLHHAELQSLRRRLARLEATA